MKKTKDIVVNLTNAFNDRNFTAIDILVAKDIKENRPGAGHGVEATKGFLMALQTAFPDFKTTINEIIGEADRVLVFTNTTGTHEGPFLFAPGIPPTGKVLSFQTADLYTIAENGTIVEHQDVIEIMEMLQKMGAIQFVTNSSSSPPSP
ncbi:ester cyclase [Candidatus Nitrosocosmicus arcticus]|uniref:Putative ester cyclase n=1 Tax=Candidatus Nitrosocosmicus arcticus TaxID=2035267 RepID=A0A557SVZ9_9ARCH|nr:ester cyclase [Candidatus Nitrosocosmicus arcticus]TVP40776.1 putative ester cyclase [Candidatus Nitrosocosmicus arcticus]